MRFQSQFYFGGQQKAASLRIYFENIWAFFLKGNGFSPALSAKGRITQ